LPPLRRAFNHVLREEARFVVDKEKGNNRSEQETAFYSSGSRQKGKEASRPKCDRCGKGHIKAKCFEILGHPSNWDTRRSRQGNTRHGEGQFAATAHMTLTDKEPKSKNTETRPKRLRYTECTSGHLTITWLVM